MSNYYKNPDIYVILLLSGVNDMKHNKKRKSLNISKAGLQSVISILCIFLSFWLLNVYLMRISGISIQKNLPLWISNSFFSISWIFLLIGVIYSVQGVYRRIIAYLLFGIFSTITCLESVSFLATGKYVTINHFSLPITQVLEFMSEGFILYFGISFLLIVVACNLFKKIEIKSRNPYQLSFSFMTILFLFGLCRGIAYYSMGPQVVYKSGKVSTDLKTTYLDYEKEHINFKISGLYDFTMRGCYHGILNQMRETDEYLRK